MNKKLKNLAIIPLFGTCILFVYLFVLSIREKISKKKFVKNFILCAVVSIVCWLMVMMIVYIFSKNIIHFDFDSLGLIITMIIGGYMMNIFTFKYIDKKWNDLSCIEDKEKKSIFEVNKKKIILIAFVFAIIISIITIAAVIAGGLV
ncbi:MAG: hypothetical protein IKD20_04500 [Clostridia bacterium]|nr:hypothetical protein [Clostridia bacterium]